MYALYVAGDPWTKKEHYISYKFPEPSHSLERLKLEVFEDFNRRKYYLTSGSKFGGDFLAYPGKILIFNDYGIVYKYAGRV